MAHRLFDFSSDVGVEAEAPTLGEAFVELGRALAQVLTDGSAVRPRDSRDIDVAGARDVASAAVDFLNELVFLFDAEAFLLADGTLSVEDEGDGIRVRGTIRGEAFDPARHNSGRGVKAATLHDAEHLKTESGHRLRIVLDL